MTQEPLPQTPRPVAPAPVVPKPSEEHPFKSKSFRHSLGFALHGLRAVCRTERNFQTHLVMTLLVSAAGFYFHVSPLEWGLLLLAMTLMLVVEILNTAIEYLVDMLAGGQYHEKAKMVKDIAAGACLICAVGVALTGLAVFLPHLLIMLAGR